MKDTKTCFDEKIGEQPDLACEEEDSLFFQSIELTNLSVLHYRAVGRSENSRGRGGACSNELGIIYPPWLKKGKCKNMEGQSPPPYGSYGPDLLVIVGDATHSVPWSVPTVNQHSVSFGCCLVVFVLQNLFLTLSDSWGLTPDDDATGQLRSTKG